MAREPGEYRLLDSGRALIRFTIASIDRCVPPALLEESFDVARRARLTTAMHLASVVLIVSYWVSSLAFGIGDRAALWNFSFAVAFAIPIFLLRKTRSLELFAGTLIGLGSIQLLLLAFADVTTSLIAIVGLTLIPVYATMVAGTRMGIAFTACSLSVFGILYRFGSELSAIQSRSDGFASFARDMMFMTVAIGLFSVLHESIRKRSLRDAELKSRFFTQAFESNPEGLVITETGSGRIVACSQAFLEAIGATDPGDVVGRLFDSVVATPGRLAPAITAGEAKGGRIREPFEFEVELPSGGRRHFHASTTVVAIDGEKRILITSIDDTKRNQAEAELVEQSLGLSLRVLELESDLEQTTLALGDIRDAVSDEMRAPLRSILGFSEILAEELAGSAAPNRHEARELLERISCSALEMQALVDALSELAKIRDHPLDYLEIDVTSMAKAITGRLAAHEPERRIEIKIEEDLRVWADPILFRRALAHLIENAWKFTSERNAACVEISAGIDGVTGFASILVKDDGAGFDADSASGLFQPFHRLHESSRFPGRGLGLATVQRVADRHGGRAWADARPSQGATVQISLPPRPAIA